ncbi:Splicing factor 45 [Galemys pyrenaicus]|uniref:Splicing factor 45 n=1 Tax=Galemys pyrenaicus TaxID=202257 RepID=A0A8J6AK52_GALPY|nr:Splicing factor 45 [Galemys pyrenaicus]
MGVETSDSETEGWSKNFKLLQSQLQVKKATLTQAKSQRTKQRTVLAPVIDLKQGGSSDDQQIVDTSPHVAAALKDSVPSGFSAEVLIPLADEYDPMFPNDYEKVVKRRREERQRQQELEKTKRNRRERKEA